MVYFVCDKLICKQMSVLQSKACSVQHIWVMDNAIFQRQFYFDLGLPHPSVVSSWLNVMDSKPGFYKESINSLQRKSSN